MSNSTTRFSDRVGDYVKYRPHYPETVIEYLRATYSITPHWTIADIGSGTGISSELFLRNGNRVYGVEPNRDMREKAEELLSGGYDGRFISIDGAAEATSLPDGSIQMVLAGQAFHWFDPIKSRVEFSRILRPDGVVVLIWNERLIASSFESGYEDLILRYASDYQTINHKNIPDERIAGFFHPAAFALAIFPNEQVFDFEGLKGRLLSSSYIPKEGSRYAEMMHGLRGLFDRHAEHGRVRVGYDTKVYSGVLKPSIT
jgi:SAM-dependent methyltransferase